MRSKAGFVRYLFLRAAVLTLILSVAATAAHAYTVVLRNGRVIEIPKTFSVSASTITYEVSPGFQVTLQLVAIDVAATDRANREPAGSFLGLLKANQTQMPRLSTSTTAATARREITNKDLEPFASVRRQSERAYEQRRKELGFSSKDALRRQADTEAQRKKLDQTLGEDAATEAYWRERANNLRSDMAAVDAEIGSVSQQLDLLPQPNTFSSVTIGTGFSSILPFGGFNGGPLIQQNRSSYNRFSVSPFGFRRTFRDQYPFYPNFGIGYQPYDVSYERSTLRMRLNELVGRRAGLQARWRVLEDEARRAGAYPGWLRP